MLQDSVGGGRNSGYYPQSFGTPGNVGGPLGGMHGGMGIGQPAQRGRPRATSNIGMQGNQNQASGISQWQNNVQASQAPPPTIVDQRSNPGYVSSIPQQSQYVVVDGPQDPGARPTVKGQGLSKQEKKAILDDWQQKSDKYEAYKTSLQKTGRGRSKSQPRFNDGQYISPGGTLAFPQSQSGYGSQPSSDIERAMRGMNIKSQGNDASAQRQAERGRRLSGGVLGLTGSAAQQAQMEQERRMRERSRSRQPQDETMGAIRPQYMPTGRGNISNINTDSGIINTGQPTVYPTANSQYVNAGVRQEMGHAPAGQYVNTQGAAQQNPYGYHPGGQQPQVSPAHFGQQLPHQNVGQQPQPSPVHFGQQLPYQNVGQQPQPSPAMYGQQLPQQTVGQQPGVSPAMYGQQLPPQAQFNQSQFVPVTTMGGIATMGIPIGHVNQFPAFAQGQTGVSPMPSPIDGSNMAPYLTPAFINQPMPQTEQQPTRRKANIANVMNSQQQQQQQQQFQQYVPNPYINPKTILTPAPPPKQLHTSNINNINNGGAQPQQVQTRNRALSQSGYVTGAPSSQPSVGAGNRNSAYINPSGGGVENNTAYPTRPGLGHNDSLQTTGPQGFGSRPSHTREPSYKATIKPTSQGSRTDSETQRSGVPVVSMRRPNPDMHPQHFTPKVISYDLNGEHRQDVPLRFGKFIYERDCTHEEWNLFTQQILETWGDRNPAYNYYHSAVKRIDAILSAWNFAFFHSRGMDVVLFKGNERRSGPRFGEPESGIDFLPEASPVSDDEEDSSEESDDEENPMTRLASQNPQYRAQVEREKQARRAYRAEEKRREAAAKPLEAPHSLVIYEIAMPTGNESYR